MPKTRERVRHQYNLRDPSPYDGPSPLEQEVNERTTLLPFHRPLAPNVIDSAYRTSIQSIKSFWQWLGTRAGRNVLKCSFAYVLACMGTFLPFLYQWLGKGDGKHMVATIVVYFHPGRSAGGMIEAVSCGVIAFIYYVFIAVSSMATAVLCESQFEQIILGYVLVLVIFVGGGLGFVGWVKQRMANPLVNVACSLTSLAIITILTKENAVQTAVFSDDKIVQVAKMLVLGMTTSTLINQLVWPVSSRKDLRQSMIGTTFAISDLLTAITQSFLRGSDDLSSPAFKTADKKYRTEFATLTKNLREAKMEHYVLGTEDAYHIEAKIVNCMQRLAQDIGGLRSAATTQFTLLKEPMMHGNVTPSSPRAHPTINFGSLNSSLRAKNERFNQLSAIEEASDEASDMDVDIEDARYSSDRRGTMDSELLDLPTIRTPAEIFARFMRHLGPSMKSLTITLHEILDELPFGPAPKFEITINENFLLSLHDALELYRNARADALAHLYRSKDLGRDRVESVEADFEEVAASCGHYSFCLQDFAETIVQYLEILEELKEELEQPSRRSWRWLKFWRPKSKEQKREDEEVEDAMMASTEIVIKKDVPKVRLRKQSWEGMTTYQKFWRYANRVIHFFEREDIRFAIKVGVGAAVWAMFAFIPQTRPFYGHWRGEWGLLSYMLVCSMTSGGGNATAIARFSGTFVGALISIFVWIICDGNVYALCFCCWIVSSGCFYLITAAGKAPLGRFLLLTYNLSVLYAYSLSIRQGEDDNDEGGIDPIITEISLHRVTAVVIGCLWGLFVTNVIWPSSARQRFKNGLAALWLRMGLIWKRDPLASIMRGDHESSYMNLREEFALQTYVLSLDALRAAAASEFELSGPFKSAQYSRVMDSTRLMLDAFHAMNAVIAQNIVGSPGELALLRYTEAERKEVSGRICHLFQVLASSLMLEYPIAVNDVMPPLMHPRDRLLSKIFQFRKEEAARADQEKRMLGDILQNMPTVPSPLGMKVEAADYNMPAEQSENKDGDENLANGEEDGKNDKNTNNGNTPEADSSAKSPEANKKDVVGGHIVKALDLAGKSDVKSEVRNGKQREAALGKIAAKDEDYALLYAYALVTGQLGEEIEKVEKEIESLFGVLDDSKW